MTSQRTKSCRKKEIIFFIISTLCWLGTVGVVVIAAFSKIGAKSSTGIDILSDIVKEKLIAFSTTAVIGVLMALFIKDKARTTMYMLSLIIGSILWGEVAMYSILGIWAIDEYIFYPLYKKFKLKVSINKEIDRR